VFYFCVRKANIVTPLVFGALPTNIICWNDDSMHILSWWQHAYTEPIIVCTYWWQRVHIELMILCIYWNDDSMYILNWWQYVYSKLMITCMCYVKSAMNFMLGLFAKVRRATISFFMSVCLPDPPFVRMEQLGSHWMDFHEIWYLSIFRKSVDKFKFH
jgi:hypothetical protein